jgi:8-oxo-dGTP pyrophosphatase MutT (NUDIX family)
MKLISRIAIGLKAIRQLGSTQVGLFGLYQLGLRSGHYQRLLSASLSKLDTLDNENLELHRCLPDLPEPGKMLMVLGEQVGKLYTQADEIVEGKIRPFGGPLDSLTLTLPEPLEEWTRYESMGGRIRGQDIKLIWEPGRFGWACTLAMAYHLSKKDAYANAFWQYTEQFLASNPPYKGPHWCSAQEVSIRLIALAFALQVFAQPDLATEEQLKKIARSIAIHAERIPPTLVYARAQNNNHLIIEALGLYTASVLLPDHPYATKWHDLGWQWLMVAYETQFEPDGTYNQHSTNYHRLMLQAALWAFAINPQGSTPINSKVHLNLVRSIRWLWDIVDPNTGRVPNLGHNDGAYLLPLSVCPYHDYRPVLCAAVMLFWQTELLPDGPWSDMGLWLGVSRGSVKAKRDINTYQKQIARHDIPVEPPFVLVNQARASWAVINAAQYHYRPAHADQLHLDLWWQGLNLALDPGTYLYNADPPWENSLTSAFVHNTVTIDGKEFMQRAGRFLYLDWAQAKVLSSHYDAKSKSHTFSASHDGYRRLGITHTRTVTTFMDGHWEVMDYLDGPAGQTHTVRLHWLLPDWDYELQDTSQDPNFPGYAVILRSPRCKFTLQAGVVVHQGETPKVVDINFQLARAGELLAGSGSVLPIAGYYSPTYGVKIPALASILEVKGYLPITLKSQFTLPRAKASVILIKDDRIALVERHRLGRHYFVIPGGKLEPGETPKMAAAREAKEELGLDVKIGRLVASIWFQGRVQYYFLAEETGGEFGQMSGPEADTIPGSPKGTYQPTWIPVDELPNQPVLPEEVANLVWRSHHAGWPETPLNVPEPPMDNAE